MPNNASKNISKKFENLYSKAKQKRLLTNNVSKKFVKELEDLYKNANKSQAAITLMHLRKG